MFQPDTEEDPEQKRLGGKAVEGYKMHRKFRYWDAIKYEQTKSLIVTTQDDIEEGNKLILPNFHKPYFFISNWNKVHRAEPKAIS